MIRIAICDYRDDDILEMMKTLRKIKKELGIESQEKYFYSGESLLDEVKAANYYDLYILETMIDHQSGIEVAKQIKRYQKSAMIVFVTYYPEYAIEAYDVEAIHYILKPYTSDVFKDVFNRYFQLNHYSLDAVQVKVGTESMDIPIRFIKKIKSDNHNIYITLSTTSVPIRVHQSLKSFMQCISHSYFVCISRGIVVNLEHVYNIRKDICVFKDGTTEKISRRNESYVEKQFKTYLLQQYNRYL